MKKIELNNVAITINKMETINKTEPKQKKGLKRNIIDKYYTKDVVVEHCLNIFKKYIQINTVSVEAWMQSDMRLRIQTNIGRDHCSPMMHTK